MVPMAPFLNFTTAMPTSLALQIVVELLGGLRMSLLHLVSHHPAQQIHTVDALVHHAPAVLGPGAAPGSLVVIALVPVPAHMDRPVGELAEAALLQCLPGSLHCRVEAVLMAGAPWIWFRCAASTMASASAMDMAMGFSMMTLTPWAMQ